MEWFPFELMNIIMIMIDNYNTLCKFLSTNKFYHKKKNSIFWDKELLLSGNTKARRLSYYHKFTKFYCNSFSPFPFPSNTRILYISNNYNHESMKNLNCLLYLKKLYITTSNNINSDILYCILCNTTKPLKSLYINTINRFVNAFPNSNPITSLTIENGPDRLLPGDLPNSIKKLRFGFFTDVLEKNKLPNVLEYLDLGCIYNHKINKSLFPPTLKRLILSKNYNYPLSMDTFPSGLESITFGKYFNQEIKEGDIPEGVIELKFGYYYNCILDSKNFPKTLKIIHLPRQYTYSLEYTKDRIVYYY